MSRTTRQSPRRRAIKKQRWNRPELLESAVLVLPLVVFYELGALWTGELNGVDLITSWLLLQLGQSWFIAVQLALLTLLLAALIYRRRGAGPAAEVRFIPLLAESAIYAFSLGTLIVFVLVDVVGLAPPLAAVAPMRRGILATLVVAAGAGVHEELVFRCLGLGLLTLVLGRVFGARPFWAAMGAMLLSSLFFALAHHLGAHGEKLTYWALTYRFLAGMVFASLYQFRGFAVAVYTHALYDVYVLLMA